jgi:hypothetical protein
MSDRSNNENITNLEIENNLTQLYEKNIIQASTINIDEII